MTQETDAPMPATDDETGDEKAPDGFYYATIKDRRILVANLSPGQAMILGGLIHDSKTGGTDANLAILGKLMRLFRALIKDPADQEWLEDGILEDRIHIADFAFVFLNAKQPEPAKPAVKKPRRG